MNSTVRDVMTDSVVAVGESTPFKEVVETLARLGVSALPVTDPGGRVVGVVSEADLLVKEEGEVRVRRRLLHPGRGRLEHRKMRAMTAGELMSRPAVTIGPDASVAAAARLMTERQLGRLPVVDAHGRLLGIVTRRDLLGSFLRSDEDIRHEIVHRVIGRVLSIDPDALPVTVHDGMVTIEGRVERKSMLPLIAELIGGVEGVVGLVVRTTFESDDAPGFGHPNPWLAVALGRRSG